MTYSVLKVPLNPNQPSVKLQFLSERSWNIVNTNCLKVHLSIGLLPLFLKVQIVVIGQAFIISQILLCM